VTGIRHAGDCQPTVECRLLKELDDQSLAKKSSAGQFIRKVKRYMYPIFVEKTT
jgi:hypothetical protein